MTLPGASPRRPEPERQPRALTVALVLALLGATACGTSQPSAEPEESAAQVPAAELPAGMVGDLVQALAEEGWTASAAGEVQQPFLGVAGHVLRVERRAPDAAGDVQVFEYADSAAAERDAQTIAPDATIQGLMISWIDTPHFFRDETLMVIYVGEDASVLGILRELLGEEFARGGDNG